MIASARGLIVLTIIAAALAGLAVFLGPRDRHGVDRALVPNFDDGKVKQLVYTCPNDGTETATRDGHGWKLQDAVADDATIDATISALRAAQWHRSGPVSLASQTHCTLQFDGQTIAIGGDLQGADQTWVVRGTQALLVDSWVAHALAPGRLALHRRHPLADVAIDPHEHGVWIDPAIIGEARAAVEALELVALDGKPAPGPKAFGAEQIGTCEHDRVWIRTPTGPGCVEAAAWKAVLAADTKLAGPADQIADRRPIPIKPKKIVLPDRKELTLDGQSKVDGLDTDLERVRELLTAIATPGELVPLPTTSQQGAFYAVAADGTDVQLALWGNGIVARRGEQVAIKTSLDTVIARRSIEYRDPTRWREDPMTLTSINVDGVIFQRGAVIGEWTRKPAGKVDNALVDALAQTLAIVKAPARMGHARGLNRFIKVTFTPPAGEPSSHRIEFGRTITKDGCDGRVDNAEVTLSPEFCTAAAALHP